MKSSGFPVSFPPIWIVIPTYWGDADVGIYDHPTPLHGTSTLPRLLESLLQNDFPPAFATLILVSTTAPKYAAEAKYRVQQIIAPYNRKLNLHIADIETAQFLDQELQPHGLDLQIKSMRGYAAVRNLQLLIPAVMNAEIIIAVDDDEILPANYLLQAQKWIGGNYKDQQIMGIAGPYLNEQGDPYIVEAEKVSNILADKSIFMNETIRQAMAHPNELMKTPLALGGNMVFHRDLFTQVGFDPAITRGEDIDYLINARIAGHAFYFDPKLTITHIPPRHFEAPQYLKMRQDVIRFIYEREKLRLHNLASDQFLPYPGRLLNDDFTASALEALHIAATPEMISKFDSPEEIILFAGAHAEDFAPKYADFAAQWLKAFMLLEFTGIKYKLRQMSTHKL